MVMNKSMINDDCLMKLYDIVKCKLGDNKNEE